MWKPFIAISTDLHKKLTLVTVIYMTRIRNPVLLLLLLFTAIRLLPGGSGYCTCIQNMKLVTTKFKSGGLYEKHVVATWNLGNLLSIRF